MIELPQEFKIKGQRGFVYNQVQREGDVVIASQFDTELQKIVGYEVFIVQKYKDRMSPDGKSFIPAKEAPPGIESWGLKGWTYNFVEDAQKKFYTLTVNI